MRHEVKVEKEQLDCHAVPIPTTYGTVKEEQSLDTVVNSSLTNDQGWQSECKCESVKAEKKIIRLSKCERSRIIVPKSAVKQEEDSSWTGSQNELQKSEAADADAAGN